MDDWDNDSPRLKRPESALGAPSGDSGAPDSSEAPRSSERPLYQQFAHCFAALCNCESGPVINEHWAGVWRDRIVQLQEELPSGSGFDNGSEFSFDESRPDKLIFTTSFHHMNDLGSYCGWTDHRIILTPSFIHGFEMKVTGPDKRQIKDYIAQCFSEALDVPAELPAAE
jgi:hypothetical protein